ncbi:MAG: hypothetical protein S4CHLAM7_01270 [Chlamydiae bacterium]|nr:hypothetical protein [Chlamydiota bacterium]
MTHKEIPKILIYRDQGVWPLSYKALFKTLRKIAEIKGYEVCSINAEAVTQGVWRDSCALFVVPGGRDVPYHEALKGAGCSHIKEYVEDGGLYLGICAGAYFGTSKVVFEKGTPREISDQRELQFFPGEGWGPLFGEEAYSYEEHACAYPITMNYKGESLSVYYSGGCTFKNAVLCDQTEVLATYQDLKDEPAAIIRCKVDRGLALLMGVHIELSSKQCQKSPELSAALERDEERRELIFGNLLTDLLKTRSLA